jgi:ferrous iron transport protein A
MNLAELKKGQKATILSIEDCPLKDKLLEMGCLPGEQVEITQIAPFGDPIAISVMAYQFSIRKEDAKYILVGLNE